MIPMIDYEIIYERKQHHLTIPQLHSRKLCFGNESILKAIKHQQENTDLFITKYADDNVVKCIILDFDDKDNPKNALKDAKKLKLILSRQGLNTVIVKSGSKGYHAYIQISPLTFGDLSAEDDGVDSNTLFKKFVDLLVQGGKKVTYNTLDHTNAEAGLRGNIRVIGSIHPKTNNKCEIIDGEFKENILPNDFQWKCFVDALEYAKIHEKNNVLKERQRKAEKQKYDGDDPILENDLRTLMPAIYGGDYKEFKNGYIMMQCPFHNDSNPSMIVKKEFYYCKSCGEKGNWWSLRDKGVVDFEDDEYIRVGKKEA